MEGEGLPYHVYRNEKEKSVSKNTIRSTEKGKMCFTSSMIYVLLNKGLFQRKFKIKHDQKKNHIENFWKEI